MPDFKPKSKSPLSQAVHDQFKLLKMMASDPEVSDGQFRIAFRIMQTVDADTGWGEIGSEKLCLLIPRTGKKKVTECRRKLEELGWWKLEPGVRGRGTQHLFLENRIPLIKERLEKAETDHAAAIALAYIKKKTGLQAAALGVNFDPETGEIVDPLRGKNLPLNGSEKGVNLRLDKGSVFTPTLPHSSTSVEPLPAQDETRRASHPVISDDDEESPFESVRVPPRPKPAPTPMSNFDDSELQSDSIGYAIASKGS